MTDLLLDFGANIFIVFARIAGCILVLPGLSSARVPVRVRLYLSLAIATCIAPAIEWKIEARSSDFFFLRIVLLEGVVGFLYGFSVRIILIAVEFIGELISTCIGLTNSFYPSTDSGDFLPIVSSFLSLLVVSLMFIMDIHHYVISALMDSYRSRPIAASFSQYGSLSDIMNSVSSAFLIALKIAGPFVIYSLSVNLVFGLASKAVPQFPGYFLSVPVLLAGGLYILYVTVADIIIVLNFALSSAASRL